MAALIAHEQLLHVQAPSDVARVRRASRAAAAELGFTLVASERIVLATIELATNLLRYAGGGTLRIAWLDDPERGRGLEVESVDVGPGIEDIERAMADRFSTGGGLGGGLPGVRRLMDEFGIESSPQGTKVVARKWLNPS